MKTRPTSVEQFDRRLDILIFSAYATKPFSVKDVFDCVFEAHIQVIRGCMTDLVTAGYLEKTTTYKYKATAKTKELFQGASA